MHRRFFFLSRLYAYFPDRHGLKLLSMHLVVQLLRLALGKAVKGALYDFHALRLLGFG